jgi:hypothetical protein
VTVVTNTTASDGPATVTGTAWSYTITGLAAGPNGITVTAHDAAMNPTILTASITRNPAVAVTFAGTGGGTVSSTPTRMACNTACSATFDYGSGVSLHAEQDQYSLFSFWSVGCSGTAGCLLTMDGDQSVTATFARDTAYMCRLEGTPPVPYSSLQTAFDHAGPDGTVSAWGVAFREDLTTGDSHHVTIRGGYNGSYTAVTGTTTLKGKLTVSHGSLTVGNMTIAPP